MKALGDLLPTDPKKEAFARDTAYAVSASKRNGDNANILEAVNKRLERQGHPPLTEQELETFEKVGNVGYGSGLQGHTNEQAANEAFSGIGLDAPFPNHDAPTPPAPKRDPEVTLDIPRKSQPGRPTTIDLPPKEQRDFDHRTTVNPDDEFEGVSAKPPTADPEKLARELGLSEEKAAEKVVNEHHPADWANVDMDLVGRSDAKRFGNKPNSKQARTGFEDFFKINYGTKPLQPDETGKLPEPKPVRDIPAASALVKPTPDPQPKPTVKPAPTPKPVAENPPALATPKTPAMTLAESNTGFLGQGSTTPTGPVPPVAAPTPIETPLRMSLPQPPAPLPSAPTIQPSFTAPAPTPKTTTPSMPAAATSRVICTELHRRGLMDRKLWLMDLRFTENFLSRTHLRGYHLWALPLVRRMQVSETLTRRVEPIARWRALEIAHRLEPETYPPNRKGKLVRRIAEPICYLLGLVAPDSPLMTTRKNF